jgi:hypothetical protein
VTRSMAALYLNSDFAAPTIPKVSIFLGNTPDLSQAVTVGGAHGHRRTTALDLPGTAGSGVKTGSTVERGTLGRHGAGGAAAAGVKKTLRLPFESLSCGRAPQGARGS